MRGFEGLLADLVADLEHHEGERADMHEFLLLEVGVAVSGDFGCCDACILVVKGFLAAGLIFLFLFQEKIWGFEILILCYLVNTLLITLTKYLIQSGLSNDGREHFEVIHQLREFRE